MMLLSSNGASTRMCDELLSALAIKEVMVQTLRNKWTPNKPKEKKKTKRTISQESVPGLAGPSP